MKNLTAKLCVFVVLFTPLALRAQTATWVGGFGGNVFNNASNWGGSVPNGGSADLVFNTSGNNFVGFNSLPVSINSLSVGTGATSGYTFNGNGGILTIGAGGITTSTPSSGFFPGITFNTGVRLALAAPQTWSIGADADVTVNGEISGSGLLTKAGSGSLILMGNNTYSGGTAVTAGGLYLNRFVVSTGPEVLSNPAGTGAITVGSAGTLGAAYYDVTIGNNITLNSGGTLGGSSNGGDSSLELTGTVTLGSSATTLKIGHESDVFFGGTLTGPASTALTVQSDGTGIAIMGGTQSNIASMTADNSAIAFANASSLPASITATNGGYVSVATVSGISAPTVTQLLDAITAPGSFNGTIGFDTDEDADNPAQYSTAINLLARGFVDGQVRLGSQTSATLTGTITPVGQSYDFGGYSAQDGLLVVKSNLTERNATTTNVTVLSPLESGGAPQNGQLVALQGNNTFTGDLTLTYSSVILDSANALPGVSSGIKMGALSYAGYTENAGFANFAAFASRVSITGGSTTSILGIDSRDVIANYVDNANIATPSIHTVTDANLNLSGFTSVFLGTLTGATINSSTITAPTDGVLRFVNVGGDSPFTINTVLTQANGLVAGMAGADGVVRLNGNNTYGGGTTLQGGGLLAGDNNAFSSGAITVNQTSGDDNLVLGAAVDGVTLANNIAVTGNLNIGTGGDDDNGNFVADTNDIALAGTISGTGRLYITTPTTISGNNTYSGGTYIYANTTVTSNTGLGTFFVDMGRGATLTLDAANPVLNNLSDAGTYVFGAGTGTINRTATVASVIVAGSQNQTFSGAFTGTASALVKNLNGQLTLLGANAGQFSGTTINAGSIAIGDSSATTATFSGNVALGVTSGNNGQLFFRPGGGQTLSYSGAISNINSGVGGVTVNGNGSGIVHVTSGGSTFTGNTAINSGTLRIGGDDYWSSASATSVGTGATLRLDGNQTIRNLSGNGTVNVFTAGKTLTVNSAGNSSFSGVMTGAGGLAKTSVNTFTLSGANTYTGDTTVSAGTLVLNGSVATPLVTVASGATLKGTAALNDVVVNGTFAPGNSAALVTLDSLTLTSTAILQMELGGTVRGTGYDALNIAGALAADGTLSVSFINSFAPSAPATFNLFDSGSLTGTFATVNLQSLSSGWAWDASALYTTGELSIVASPIPEPATTALLAGLAILGVVAIRRRF